MNEEQLFKFLKEQPSNTLLDLLNKAYAVMNTNERRIVFGSVVEKIPLTSINSKELLNQVKAFYEDSLAGKYYAPFEINSKNFADIPEETQEWFQVLVDLMEDVTRLTKKEEHALAIEGFGLLYKLIDKMEMGEIVFADEVGSWMIPADESKFILAYLTSLACIADAPGFTAVVLSLIERDSFQSFSKDVYNVALKVANKQQQAYLKAEVKHQKIRTKHTD